MPVHLHTRVVVPSRVMFWFSEGGRFCAEIAQDWFMEIGTWQEHMGGTGEYQTGGISYKRHREKASWMPLDMYLLANQVTKHGFVCLFCHLLSSPECGQPTLTLQQGHGPVYHAQFAGSNFRTISRIVHTAGIPQILQKIPRLVLDGCLLNTSCNMPQLSLCSQPMQTWHTLHLASHSTMQENIRHRKMTYRQPASWQGRQCRGLQHGLSGRQTCSAGRSR